MYGNESIVASFPVPDKAILFVVSLRSSMMIKVALFAPSEVGLKITSTCIDSPLLNEPDVAPSNVNWVGSVPPIEMLVMFNVPPPLFEIVNVWESSNPTNKVPKSCNEGSTPKTGSAGPSVIETSSIQISQL